MITKVFTTIISLSLISCSSIHKTFIQPETKKNLIFAGTKNNINWVKTPPEGQEHPYMTMGIIDFAPSAFVDFILLPYTIIEKYNTPSKE